MRELARLAVLLIFGGLVGACSQGPDANAGHPEGGTGLRAEVGFFDVPPQPSAATSDARLFYAFEPADVDPVDRPLLVLFNGGPGFATSAGLLSYGTGRWTLDSADDAGPVAHLNTSRWTAFANLLYIDARQAGFSYELAATGPDGAPPGGWFSELKDASDFVRAVLDFLDGHSALRGSPVVLVGESYGGARATQMLDLLLRYTTEASAAGPDLRDRIQAHYDAVFPDRAGSVIDEATASRQFGAQVLIEPLVLPGQLADQTAFMLSDPFVGPYVAFSADAGPPDVDQNNALEPPGWTDRVIARAILGLSDPTQAARLVGQDLASAPLMRPAARGMAFHEVTDVAGFNNVIQDSQAALNQAMSSELGALRPGDAYFNAFAPVQDHIGESLGSIFVENLRTVRTFITNARYDLNIYSPAIPALLKAMGLGGTLDTSPRPGVARSGWFRVDLPAQGGTRGGAQTVEVRFPLYERSGHEVAVTQPADLEADVQAWLLGQ
jgi:hypothetical protein